MIKNTFTMLLSIGISLGTLLPAQAGVSAQQARRLEKDLTPFGAQRAGNADGSIPAWNGGMTATPEGVTYDPAAGGHQPNPFAKEKALYTITAQNMDQEVFFYQFLWRVHRSYLINSKNIHRINKNGRGNYHIDFINGESIPVGNKYKNIISQLKANG